jgi:hypothetical protein
METQRTGRRRKRAAVSGYTVRLPVSPKPPRVEQEIEQPPPIEWRGLPALVPIVRFEWITEMEHRLQPVPAKARARRVIAIAAIVSLVILGGYLVRPDDRFAHAKAMIDAYEHGLAPTERDYSLPLYSSALRELEAVRTFSSSRADAQRLAARVQREIARQRQQRAIDASSAAQ